jgi:hypothetical protein
MSVPDTEGTDPARLAELLQVSDGDQELWRPEDLAAILRHQLSIPIEFDLGSLPRVTAGRLRLAAHSKGLLLKSFADLLSHGNPPLELLRLTKQFAKANRNQPESPLPTEVATVLYYASIAAALVHRQKRITKLSNDDLRDGFDWALQQTWVDDTLRPLFENGLKRLAKRKGSLP